MVSKNIAIAIAITIILAIIIGAAVFYFQNAKSGNKNIQVKTAEQIAKEDEAAAKEAANNYNKLFPDVVDGIISIVSKDKTTVTTKDGKRYLIFPARPVSFYKDSGIDNNSSVEIRGKILENDKLSLGSIVPANK